MMLSPALKDLVYSTAMFSHMQKHVSVTKALNKTVMNLKVLQLKAGGFESPIKRKN
jgi:hypothetical protein